MGKFKGKKNFNNPNQVPGSDGFQRINFLYQASHIIMDTVPHCPQLTSYYGNQMIGIGKKLQLKIDPSIKKTICKGCKGLLVPGTTAQVQIKNVGPLKKGKHKRPLKTQVWTCLQCKCVRNFVLKANHSLWSENVVHDLNPDNQSNK